MTERFGTAALRDELPARLGYTLPAVVAPMFLVSSAAMVEAACKAGAVAAYPSLNARTSAGFNEVLDRLDRNLEGANGAGYAVNLVTHRSNPRFAEDLEICAAHRVPLIITALGSPAPAVDAVHAYGGLVFADVNSPRLARKAAAAGADGLILVCSGAGGHTGTMTPFAFVDEVRRFFDGPVIVAGGISSGAGIHGALALGADLAYMGTRFLAARESDAVAGFKQMVAECSFDDILCTDAITGALANKLRPSIVAAGIDPDSLQSGKAFDLSALEGSVNTWKDLWSAGHGLGAVTGSEPVGEIIATLKDEFAAATRRTRRWTAAA
ncbi:NAD(P)H-dependent flavin oxidoreductase [Thalassorhabdomicrobium marinisediminis]|uniref:NAD(P)H-dependent flavin oxidoreductase n=1 Tax=Thalassorhabdomicrobium marinisediminis TaxID=2170577 RepID=UPI00248FAD14|nr:nitronate monooxygenase [Thalassorhabdomicrobium marinisediminis]